MDDRFICPFCGGTLQWEKDENGVWVDKTQEVLEEQALKRQIAELEKRLRYVK